MTEDTSLREKALRDEIPEDVRNAAYAALYDACTCLKPDSKPHGWGAAVDTIARAFMRASEAKDRRIEALEAADRIEECAKLCDDIANAPHSGPAHDVWERARRQTAAEIAKRIRHLGENRGFQQVWQVEEYKIWKGINSERPVWSSLGYVSTSWDEMMDLCDYLRGNNQDIILRVVKNGWVEPALSGKEGKS